MSRFLFTNTNCVLFDPPQKNDWNILFNIQINSQHFLIIIVDQWHIFNSEEHLFVTFTYSPFSLYMKESWQLSSIWNKKNKSTKHRKYSISKFISFKHKSLNWFIGIFINLFFNFIKCYQIVKKKKFYSILCNNICSWHPHVFCIQRIYFNYIVQIWEIFKS